MRLVWLTDIHLNFVSQGDLEDLLDAIRGKGPDAILLTGDIGEADNIVLFLKLLDMKIRRPILFVLGNHDFYRGSIARVRERMTELRGSSENLVWLGGTDVVSLSETTGVVGHDGWGDARLGNALDSPVLLNDFFLIADLAQKDRADLRAALHALGDESAAHIRAVLPIALERHRQVFVLTHVPPFREAAWYNGQPSNDDWLPFFSCKAVGDALQEIVPSFPDRNVTVLCGHTHGQGVCQPLPNLTVLTGGAEYGRPAIQRVFDL